MVGDILKENLYKNTLLARLYGGSFGVILNDYKKSEIEKVYLKIVSGITRSEELKGMIQIYTVLQYVSASKGINLIYKKIQIALEELEHKLEERYLFIE
jgi:GGDEF domain-containing protein